MSYIRTLGSFLYSAAICIAFFLLAVWLLVRCIIYAEGFFMTFFAIFGIVLLLSWLGEKGIIITGIPFNWLWDKNSKTRIAAMIPPIPIGLWCITTPFRIPLHFSTGDWIVTILWAFCVFWFYWNMFTFPAINPHIGKKTDNE